MLLKYQFLTALSVTDDNLSVMEAKHFFFHYCKYLKVESGSSQTLETTWMSSELFSTNMKEAQLQWVPDNLTWTTSKYISLKNIFVPLYK